MTARKLNRKGHEKLKEFLISNHLEEALSERAKNVLLLNMVTLSEFISFKHIDFKKLRWSDRHIASELLAISKQSGLCCCCSEGRPLLSKKACLQRSKAEGLNHYVAPDNKVSIIVDNKIRALSEYLACAHEEGLSNILMQIPQTAYIETFNKIFSKLKSIFIGDSIGALKPLQQCSTIYQYLFSIRNGNICLICSNAESFTPIHKNTYEKYRLNNSDATLLNYFDEALYQSCIAYIGHTPNDEAHIRLVIIEAMDELQKRNDVFSLLPSNSRIILYQLKYGEMPAFAIVNTYVDRLPDREKRILFQSIVANKSYDVIGIEEGLTKERVRQIFFKTTYCIQDWAQKNGVMDVIKNYKYDEYAYITPINSRFSEIKAKEALDYDFDFFCFIISIMYDGAFTLFNRDKITPKRTIKITYLCNRKLMSIIDLYKIQESIQKQYNDPLNKEIALNPIIGKREYWQIERMDNQSIKDVKGLLTYVCQECYDLKVIDADEPYIDLSEHFEPEKIKSIICEILSRNNIPMSLESIKIAMVQHNPMVYNNLSIEKLKSFLSDKNLFAQIGLKAIYTLSSSKNFAGSVHQSIRKILTCCAEPIKMEYLIQRVLLLRPDSNTRSVRAVVTSMIKNDECILYEDSCVGLNA